MQNSTGVFRKELLPLPRTFYARELGKLSRPSRGWAMGRCPFHESKSGKSFSVNLDSGGFYCHGCQAKGGDLISFVRLRYKLDFRGACRELGCWDETGIVTREQVRRLQKEQERKRAEQAAREEQMRQDRILNRDHLHTLERVYKQANKRLAELRQGAPEKYAGEQEQCWQILSDALPQIRNAAVEYSRLSGVGDGE